MDGFAVSQHQSPQNGLIERRADGHNLFLHACMYMRLSNISVQYGQVSQAQPSFADLIALD